MKDTPLASALLSALKQSVGNANELCVAFSGGLDSAVLLYLCHQLYLQDRLQDNAEEATTEEDTGEERTTKQFVPAQHNSKYKISAIHVHHGLSPNADDWASHCESICKGLNIPLNIVYVNIAKQARKSLEQQAREARYEAIGLRVNKHCSVLLAQHQDDQAETYLLQLARGSGSKGLSAMPSEFIGENGHTFKRPLLTFTRESLLQFAQENALKWIEDESNEDQQFERNYLRHSVLPVLKVKWPAISATISRSAKHHAQAELVVNEYMTLLSQDIIDDAHRLNIPAYERLSHHSKVAMLRFWLSALVHVLPSTANLEAIMLMINASSDAQPECRWSDYIVRRFSGYLYLCHADQGEPPKAFDIILEIDKRFSHHVLPFELELTAWDQTGKSASDASLMVADGKFTVDFGGFSRRFKLSQKRPSKLLKHCFQEWDVPPWERTSVPVLSQNEKVIAVGEHVGVSADTAKLQATAPKLKYCLHFYNKPTERRADRIDFKNRAG